MYIVLYISFIACIFLQDPSAAQTAYNSKFIEPTFLWENSRSTYESAENVSYNPAKNLGRLGQFELILGIWVAQFFQARDKVRQYYTIFARASTWFFLVIHTYCQAPLTVEIFLPKKKIFYRAKKGESLLLLFDFCSHFVWPLF